LSYILNENAIIYHNILVDCIEDGSGGVGFDDASTVANIAGDVTAVAAAGDDTADNDAGDDEDYNGNTLLFHIDGSSPKYPGILNNTNY